MRTVGEDQGRVTELIMRNAASASQFLLRDEHLAMMR